MVQIIQKLVPTSVLNNVTSGYGNPIEYIVIHETANTSKGANALAHANLQYRGNSRSASWHYTVDDSCAYQSFDDHVRCWHAGNSTFNKNSIGIEICVNEDGNYLQAVKNAAELTKMLMAKHGVPKSKVVQHNKASGKDCPRYLRNGSKGIDWNGFLALLDGKAAPSPTPVQKPTPAPTSGPDYNTNSLVDFLKSIGEDSSFTNRKRLASAHGVSLYVGTASQNTKLLEALKAEYKAKQAPKVPSPAPSKAPAAQGDMNTNSIVDYLKSIGKDSSFNNRKKLAQQYGIPNYAGTVSQNAQLLSKLRGGSAPAPTPAPAPKRNPYAGGNAKTTSVVDYLKSIGKDSSFASRKRIASELGISNYQGTASQNEELLRRMRG